MTLKSNSLSLLMLSCVLGLTACNLPNDRVTQAAAAVSGSFSSGEILQVLQVLNTGEIRQAELANARSSNRSIQNSARQIELQPAYRRDGGSGLCAQSESAEPRHGSAGGADPGEY